MGNTKSIHDEEFNEIINKELNPKEIKTTRDLVSALCKINKHPKCKIDKEEILKIQNCIFSKCSIKCNKLGKELIVGIWNPYTLSIKKISILILFIPCS